MPVLTNIGTLATCRDEGGQEDIHVIEDAAMAWRNGTVAWVGAARALPEAYAGEPTIDAAGRLVVPGLVDAHTHLAFGGWRADEFELRLRGASYLEIARRGGGIRSTMRATRAAWEDERFDRRRTCRQEMARRGGRTVEAKSGYGLNVDDELKTLRVYRRLRQTQPQTIVPTFLGAHTVPPEFESDRAGYLRLLTDELIPRIADEGLAEYCDALM